MKLLAVILGAFIAIALTSLFWQQVVGLKGELSFTANFLTGLVIGHTAAVIYLTWR